MNKLYAVTTHLILTSIMILIFLGATWFVFYPYPYFKISGGQEMILILSSTMIVLGPLLTLVVFKPGKSGLKFDLICIGLAQLIALIYGGIVIYKQRPAYIVFAVDRFTTIPAADIDLTKLKYPELKPPQLSGPLLAHARSPDDQKARQELLFGVLLDGEKDIEYRPELYHPYKPDIQELRSRSLDITHMTAFSSEAKKVLDRFISRQGGRTEDYLYLPLRGRNKDIVMVLSPKDGMPVGFLPISPWPEDYR